LTWHRSTDRLHFPKKKQQQHTVKCFNRVRMDILNNREWALVICFFVLILFVLISPKMVKYRSPFKEVIKVFFARPIVTTLALMLIYITIMCSNSNSI